MAMGQNLRYLFRRDYHLFKRLLRVGVRGFDPFPYSTRFTAVYCLKRLAIYCDMFEISDKCVSLIAS